MIKFFYCHITYKLAQFHYQTVYIPIYSVKWFSRFMLRHLMTSWHANIWKVKTWLFQRTKRTLENKKYFSLFLECSFLDIQNKLAKLWRTQPLRKNLFPSKKVSLNSPAGMSLKFHSLSYPIIFPYFFAKATLS